MIATSVPAGLSGQPYTRRSVSGRDLISIQDFTPEELAGAPFFVDQTQSRLGARESLSDVAHNLERWVDGVVLRTFAHETVTTMATHASIPVINALSELEHPCQALGDM